jgi:phytoene dehydrogenase-like protein
MENRLAFFLVILHVRCKEQAEKYLHFCHKTACCFVLAAEDEAMHSYIVVGGGLAGLTAANALAQEGIRVTLLEQSRQPGGRAQTQERNGYRLNLGPHALFSGGVAAQTFREWQIPFSGHFPPATAQAYFVREGQLYPMVRDLSSLATTRLFGVREKLEAGRLLSLFSAGEADASETMQQWLNRHVHSQRIYDLAATLTRISTYATDLNRLSARAALKQIAMGLKHKVLYLDGGWQMLVDGLKDRALSLGVEILCEQPVNDLNSLDADGVVLAVGPASVEKLTGRSLPQRQPLYMATLDLALDSVPEDAARLAFCLDKPFYFSMHSASARLAPEGGALIHVAQYLGDTQPDPVAVRAELEEYATLVMPQWRRHAQVTRFLPNLTVTPMMPTLDGRPDVDFLGMENVMIAGDWVGDEGMLADASAASALKAASMIQRHKTMVA